ncbi:hypothetical protein CHLNCDRAFT_137069 [Chlorella variabilis]|uniref:Uncharacterized protein n=1 Tax=Chlorella variabilis TaxID=554065 RepID=E1ZLX5_CHLVA|nr:hypothetical protein CHLNCDRAFT_137069 [Chlorella variabilis]EFN53341.1 hypothetical protein CHLNCDRAFT_137069 [Chlorella variabilis]|eukprot:XP_005845443.1 hypothetical protein CHLNCDRAFT_137069 [Chlorella variabilis]
MWVRIVALERYKGFRGRRLAQAGSEQAASIIQQQQQQQVPATANQTSEGGVPGGLLPLTAALRRALDIGRADLLADMDTGEDGVTAAAAAGSLDSYLYGDMPDLNSGRNSYPKADHINFVTRQGHC